MLAFNKHNERMRECIRRIKISGKRREGSVCVGKVRIYKSKLDGAGKRKT